MAILTDQDVPSTPQGFDENAYISGLFRTESGGNPAAVTGSNRGLGQWGPEEERKYGITNWLDPAQQRRAVQLEMQEHAPILTRALGRPPTPGEFYFTHQQGPAGGPALLNADPNIPAWQVVRPFYKSDAIAKQAITGNIPSDHPLRRAGTGNETAGDFRNMWISKFEKSNAPPLSYQVAQSQQQPQSQGLLGVLGQQPQQQAPPAANTQQQNPSGGLLSQEEQPVQLRPMPQMQLPEPPMRAAMRQRLLMAALNPMGNV